MRALVITVGYLCLFCLSLTVNTWGNDFPISYHADEPGKVAQVLGIQPRNHRHPPLLLDLTWITHKVRNTGDGFEQVVNSGRWVSAIAGALAVVMLTATAHLLLGGLPAFLAGIMVAFNPSLMVFSHYMKEDVLLFMGFSAMILTATVYWRTGRWWAAMLLGIACVLTVMGKYIGIVMVLGALVIFVCRFKSLKKKQRLIVTLSFAGGLVSAILLFGYHWWADLNQAFGGLAYEWNHVRSGHTDLKLTLPGAILFYGLGIQEQLQHWPIPLSLLGVYWMLKKQTSSARVLTCMIVGVLLIYGILLLISRVPGDRYALPIVVMIAWFAALGLWGLVVIFSNRFKQKQKHWKVVASSLLVGVCAYQVHQVTYQFDHDGRPDMWQWVQANLSSSDIVVEDFYCAMPDQRYELLVKLYGKWQPKIRINRQAAQFGTLDKLKRSGVTHVAVCNYSYDRFINTPGLEPTANDEEAQARVKHTRQFYWQLFAEYPVVWSHQPRYNLPGLTSPKLHIFQLNQGDTSEKSE
ncbi:MAG: ArnT family glycosyltransferase [Phycisphaeraceae bacterium JB051]